MIELLVWSLPSHYGVFLNFLQRTARDRVVTESFVCELGLSQFDHGSRWYARNRNDVPRLVSLAVHD